MGRREAKRVVEFGFTADVNVRVDLLDHVSSVNTSWLYRLSDVIYILFLMSLSFCLLVYRHGGVSVYLLV